MKKVIVFGILAVFVTAGAVRGQESWKVELAGSFENPWDLSACISANGDYALIGGWEGIHIVSVTDLYNPVEVSFWPADSTVLHIEMRGMLAFAYVKAEGIKIIDLFDPENPVLMSTIACHNGYADFDVENNYVYAIDSSRIRIYDIIDPADPQFAGEYYREGFSLNYIDVEDGIAYTGGGMFVIIDVSDPANPVFISQEVVMEATAHVTYYEEHVYLANPYMSYILCFNVSDPYNPEYVSTFSTNFPGGITIGSDMMHVMSEGVVMVDVEDPTTMLEIGRYTGSMGSEAFAREAFVYINTGYSGMRILDASDPGDVTVVSTYMQGGSFRDSKLTGDHAAVIEMGSGIRMFDISNAANPVPLNLHETFCYYEDVEIDGDLMVLGTRLDGVETVDISDPANPQTLGFYELDLFLNDVALSGDYAYAAGYSDYVSILDISDPAQIELAGTFYADISTITEIVISGNIAYLCASWNGLAALDISNPSDPELMAIFESMHITCAAAEDNYLYAGENDTLQIIDFSDPYYPVIISETGFAGAIESIEKAGNHLIIWIEPGDIHIIDVRYPENPSEEGYYTGAGIQGVSEREGLIYAGTIDEFLVLDAGEALGVERVPDAGQPVTFSLSPIYPNPFNAQTTIPFTLDRAGKVTLNIYNMTGQNVGAQTFVPAVLPAGAHEYVWNAKGMSSGVYLVRLQQQSAGTLLHEARKAVLVK